jgi:predicted transcriptional regulator
MLYNINYAVYSRTLPEIESAIETLEIMNDNETLKAIEEGLQDIKNGRVIKFEDFLKKHGYEL